MRNLSFMIMSGGLALAILISNIASFVNDGKELERLRSGVLRLHVLANSDSAYDQSLKLKVRDAILENSDELFVECSDVRAAEGTAIEKLDEIERIAEETLAENGCDADVRASVGKTYFDERTYGDITMPEGEYTALRVEIGEAEGRNWWCVMYPPLCIPAACEESVDTDEEAEEEFFDKQQQDILYNPTKYRVRFALWDKLMSLIK